MRRLSLSMLIINTGNRYLDILAHEEKVFALTDGFSIHIWNLKDKFNINTIMPTERPYFTTMPKDNHVYLLWHNNSFWTISSLIFVGLNQTKALKANRNPIFAKNTIIFADDYFYDWASPSFSVRPVDTGMFTLTEGKSRPLPTKRLSEIQARPLLIKRSSEIQPTIWLFPSGF
ncbi:hypothetical protein Q3G72_030163 [Acer saccharum]|nr:hypothetical protein Q3G72_030163 [Acer saccharum]